MMLTPRMKDMLDYIQGYIRDHDGVSPTFDEMRKAMDYRSKSRVFETLARLEERGHIVRLKKRQRSIQVVGKRQVPLVTYARAEYYTVKRVADEARLVKWEKI